MASSMIDHLKSLHTSAIDARNGYREALKDAEGKEAASKVMMPLFRDMIALHDGHAAELARELQKNNELPDEGGSFMTTVHEAIMDLRSMFDGLDESVLPASSTVKSAMWRNTTMRSRRRVDWKISRPS